MRANYKMQRLFVDVPLAEGAALATSPQQAHYLKNVLRMKPGDALLVFNGRDGEWLAEITAHGKGAAELRATRLARAQTRRPDLHYCFAPIKAGRLDYLVQKAVEMGAGVLQPVITQHTQMARIGTEKLRANALEAAEQCGILSLPEVREPVKFDRLLVEWSAERTLVFCDESAAGNDPLPLIAPLKGRPLGLLVGPEGGFSDAERRHLASLSNVVAIPLGPRILRADTAAVAALALLQATAGDWSDEAD